MAEERIAMRNGDSNFCVALSVGERGARYVEAAVGIVIENGGNRGCKRGAGAG